MNSIQAGAISREIDDRPQAHDRCPHPPVGHYKERSVEPLTQPADNRHDKEAAVCPPAALRQLPVPGAQHKQPGENIKLVARQPDISDPNLTVNSQTPNWLAPEQLVKAPPCTPTLEKDEALLDTLQQPHSLALVAKALTQRRAAEKKHQEFTFDLLMPTLRNMQTFIRHIRDGKQFTDPLTGGEEQAMVWLAEKTQALLDAGAPYKRTVYLAIALMAVSEIITRRQVLDPLLLIDPVKKPACAPTGLNRIVCALLPAVDPALVQECRWGGNNPDGLDEIHHFISRYVMSYYLKEELPGLINDNSLFLFPSFQQLDPKDFCYFGHLPVHPIGMTTAYAINADGLMHSPLRFAIHDINHTLGHRNIDAYRKTPLPLGQSVLQAACQRLDLRSLVLDQIPASLVHLKLKPALLLLLFDIFHEKEQEMAAAGLDCSYAAFIYCLTSLADARRINRAGYSETYQSVTDVEAAQAALWMLRLWACWKAADFGPVSPSLPSQAQREASAQLFLEKDIPMLDAHLAFVKQHRGVLRQLFADRLCHRCENGEHLSFLVTSPDFAQMRLRTLFNSRHNLSGLSNLDNTDLAYFLALQHPWLREEMESATGARLPE
ncbi:MAG: hypothetical protein OXC07_01070 [Kistimonas sp.]|nr:hypothetical protein [Kistimonas sp.]